MSDLISRQAAIDVLRTCYDTEAITYDNGNEYIDYDQALDLIEQLPSAQPDWNEMLVICDNCGHAIHVKREDKKMTREKAIDLLEGIIKGTDESPLYDAIRMGLDALKAQEPEDFCEACQIHYPEDEE